MLSVQVYGLKENPEVLSAKAEVAYYQQDTQMAYKLAKVVYQADPHNCRQVMRLTRLLTTFVVCRLRLKQRLYPAAFQSTSVPWRPSA
jgi:hypothetical protein